jgi:hypothetical protein
MTSGWSLIGDTHPFMPQRLLGRGANAFSDSASKYRLEVDSTQCFFDATPHQLILPVAQTPD